MDKMRKILKNKSQLIGVILIAVILIISIIAIIVTINGKKMIPAESNSDISTESTTFTNSVGDKTACGIKIKFLYEEKYWEKYDLTNAVYKTQGEYEDAVCNYIDEIAKLLNKQDWYKQNNKDIDTLYIKLVVQGKEYYEKSKIGKEEYDDTMPITARRASTLEDYTPKAYLYTMTFNSAIFDHGIVPIIHQLTDLITYKQVNMDGSSSFSSSLKNGLGEYTQRYLGMGIASCNHGLDIHNYLIEHEKTRENDPTITSYLKLRVLPSIGLISSTIGATSTVNSSTVNSSTVTSSVVTTSSLPSSIETSSIGTSSLGSINYNVECCSSFVDYLVQIYGIDNVMKMVDGYGDDTCYLFNQNGLAGLISDWQQFLSDYPCKMTWDEMNAYMTEFRNTHGY